MSAPENSSSVRLLSQTPRAPDARPLSHVEQEAPVRLRLGDAVRDLVPGRPLVMGILNASPTSFSDGGQIGGLEEQVERGLSLVAAGADLVDVGGESSSTVGEAVDAREERARIEPLVARLAGAGVVVSVDTWKAEVARAAIAAGAVMVNDVSGLRDPGLATACAEGGAALVVLHTRAAPKVKGFPGYADVTADVLALLRERMDEARRHGVTEDQLVVDPGPDFAKTPAETVTVLRELPRVRALGRPVLLAVSRKDFIGALTGRPPRERLAGTLAAVGAGADAGAGIVRVHDVAQVRDFLTVRAAVRGEAEVPPGPLTEHLRRESSASVSSPAGTRPRPASPSGP